METITKSMKNRHSQKAIILGILYIKKPYFKNPTSTKVYFLLLLETALKTPQDID